MIYDIVFIGIIVLFTVIGIKRKASRTLVGLAAAVLAFMCALWLSNILGGLVYDAFFRGGIVNLVNDRIAAANVETPENLVDVALGAIPAIALSIMGYFGSTAGDLETYLEKEAADGSRYIADSVADLLKAPLSGVISFVLLIIFFIILLIIFNSLSKIVLKVFCLPVINTIDSILGGVFGLLEGILFVILCALIIHLLMPTLSQNGHIFTEEYVSKSFIMSNAFAGGLVGLIQTWFYDVGKILS